MPRDADDVLFRRWFVDDGECWKKGVMRVVFCIVMLLQICSFLTTEAVYVGVTNQGEKRDNMTKKVILPDQIAQFNRKLSQASLALPCGFRFVNPFQGQQKDAVNKLVSAFCEKYYAESKPRRMILGSSPARRGTAVSGIPFEDPRCLSLGNDSDTGKFYVMPSSSGFLSEVMEAYGGREKFYADFYMGFVCPLGIVRVNSKGKEVNCNYYEDKKLRNVLHPFIVATLYQQLNFGIDRTVCYCIGSGDNYRFLSKLNEEHDFFDRIVPLEHPRFIMQYHSKDKEKFMKKYIDALSSC